MKRETKVVDLAEKRRELRGHITETGELITLDSRRHRRIGEDDDDDGPRAA